MEDPGATALMLVTVLISDLQAKGLVASAELSRAMEAYARLPMPLEQRRAADNALALLKGLTQRMGG